MSNWFSEVRNNFREQIRKQDIKIKKENIRNLMIALSNSSSIMQDNTRITNDTLKCALCDNKWILFERIQKFSNLIVEIFHKNYICIEHIEHLFRILIHKLNEEPSYFNYLFSQNQEKNTQIYLRKVSLLNEIFDNQTLMQNQDIQLKIFNNFNNIGGFAYKLMDRAFGLNVSNEIQQQSLFINSSIKRLSFNTALYILLRYPLLLKGVFNEYPLIQFFRACNEQKLMQIYKLMIQIFQLQTSKQLQMQQLNRLTEIAFFQHLQQIKNLRRSVQLQKEIMKVITSFILKQSEIKLQFLELIIQFCIKKSYSNSLNFSQLAALICHKCEHRQQINSSNDLLNKFYQLQSICRDKSNQIDQQQI